MFPQNGAPMERAALFPEPSFTFLSNSSIKVLLIKNKFLTSLEGPRKGAYPHVSPKWGP